MFEKEKQQMLDYALKMDRYGLIALSGGNLSWRMPSGEVIVTPSGMIYDEMVADDMLVVDLDGNIIEGTRKASVDTEALLYIYKNMPKVNAVILAMGVEAVKAIGDRLAVVLKHHGVIAVGRDLRQALFACVYLEEACKTIQVALSTGLPMATMTQEQIDEAVAVFHRYGQVTLNERDAAEAAYDH